MGKIKDLLIAREEWAEALTGPNGINDPSFIILDNENLETFQIQLKDNILISQTDETIIISWDPEDPSKPDAEFRHIMVISDLVKFKLIAIINYLRNQPTIQE